MFVVLPALLPPLLDLIMQNSPPPSSEVQAALIPTKFVSYEFNADAPLEGEGPALPRLKTSSSFVESMLISHGVTASSDLETLVRRAQSFVEGMRATGCYESLHCELTKVEGGVGLDIKAREKNWYKVAIGGNVSPDFLGTSPAALSSITGDALTFPDVKFESSCDLFNVKGDASTTSASYAVDPAGVSSYALTHSVPSPNVGPFSSWLYAARSFESDHHVTRGYHEASKGISVALRKGSPSPLSSSPFAEVEWFMTARDSNPAANSSSPSAGDVSKEIVAECGPNFKHGVRATASTNGTLLFPERFAPIFGYDSSISGELCGPPGDVGFIKGQFKGSLHLPLSPLLCFHFNASAGAMKSLPMGGYCSPSVNVSDR